MQLKQIILTLSLITPVFVLIAQDTQIVLAEIQLPQVSAPLGLEEGTNTKLDSS